MRKITVGFLLFSFFCTVAAAGPAIAANSVLPVAILPFEARGMGMQEQGNNIRDLMFIHLSNDDQLVLVERTELDKILNEAELNLSGMVADQKANQVGMLTGAKILITGSIFEISGKTYLVAKIIGTETGNVVGESINGPVELDVLVEKLANQVSLSIAKNADGLLPEAMDRESGIEKILEKIKGKKLPRACVDIKETHISREVIDPAAETEMTYIYKQLGGKIIDKDKGTPALADYRIIGEGFSEFATRIKNLVSVKARLEVKVLDRSGEVVAVDRQVVTKIDLNEQLAGKEALKEATILIAERLIPQLAQ